MKKQQKHLGLWFGNKITNKIIKPCQNTSETVESKTGIPKEKYISPEEGQKTTDELRLIMINVDTNAKIAMYVKKIIFWILLHVVTKMINI